MPELNIDLININPADVPRRIIEDFIADVRKLCIIYGSQAECARMLNMSESEINRWFRGLRLPRFEHYVRVKQKLVEEVAKARQENPNAGG